MARIDVKILTTKGQDTKYLFPGSVSKSNPDLVNRSDPGSSYWIYDYDVVAGAKTQHFKFKVFGGSETAPPNDLNGYINGWQLLDPSYVYIHFYDNPTVWGKVEINHAPQNGTTLGPISTLTPDAIVDQLVAKGRTADFHFLGNKGNDTLRGSKAGDELDGGRGADSMIGGYGDDKYYVNSIGDKVVDGTDKGYDRVYTKIDYTLSKNLESLVGSGTRNFELTGNARNNDISGSSGNDTLKGLDGNDQLAAVGGKDVLYGGKGKDFFMFVSGPDGDVIKDFKHSDDTIIISQYAHPGLTTPDHYYARPFPDHPIAPSLLNPNGFHASKSGKAHDFDDRILYNTNNGNLFFDPDGTGSAPRQLIATLSGHPPVAYDDFLII
jgi:hypothetical protein